MKAANSPRAALLYLLGHSLGTPAFDHVVSIAIDDDSCAIKSDGTTWCWGAGNGLGDGVGGVDYFHPHRVMTRAGKGGILLGALEVSAGPTGNCIYQGGLHPFWCWGDNALMQLGNTPSVDPYATPVTRF